MVTPSADDTKCALTGSSADRIIREACDYSFRALGPKSVPVNSPFRSALAALQTKAPVKRVWHYLPYDQLSAHFLTVPPSQAGVVLI